MRWLINVAQAARTPMDKKSGKSIQNYVTKLHKMVDGLIPWRKDKNVERLKKLKEEGPGASGEKALAESEAFAKSLGL